MSQSLLNTLTLRLYFFIAVHLNCPNNLGNLDSNKEIQLETKHRDMVHISFLETTSMADLVLFNKDNLSWWWCCWWVSICAVLQKQDVKCIHSCSFIANIDVLARIFIESLTRWLTLRYGTAMSLFSLCRNRMWICVIFVTNFFRCIYLPLSWVFPSLLENNCWKRVDILLHLCYNKLPMTWVFPILCSCTGGRDIVWVLLVLSMKYLLYFHL